MGAPLLDLSLQSIIKYNLDTIKADPERRVKEIFGDARIQPLAALYGEGMLKNVEHFFREREIPVVLGFNLDAARIPGVSIHLERSAPAQQYMGSAGQVAHTPIREKERTVDVPAFSPLNVDTSDPRYYVVTPPKDCEYERILPGLHWRCADGNEYGIGQHNGLPTMIPFEGCAPLEIANTKRLEVITPWRDLRYREGAMTFDETGLVTVHGSSDRDEGLWLWTAVQHGLLKYRKVLESVYGLQLAVPMSSDFAKDDSFMPSNVWRRFISVSCRATWTWETPPMVDVSAYLMHVRASNRHFEERPVPLDTRNALRPEAQTAIEVPAGLASGPQNFAHGERSSYHSVPGPCPETQVHRMVRGEPREVPQAPREPHEGDRGVPEVRGR